MLSLIVPPFLCPFSPANDSIEQKNRAALRVFLHASRSPRQTFPFPSTTTLSHDIWVKAATHVWKTRRRGFFRWYSNTRVALVGQEDIEIIAGFLLRIGYGTIGAFFLQIWEAEYAGMCSLMCWKCNRCVCVCMQTKSPDELEVPMKHQLLQVIVRVLQYRMLLTGNDTETLRFEKLRGRCHRK